MKNLIIIFLFSIGFIKGQCNCLLYEKGINFIKQDFAENGVQKYYNEILLPKAYGISIYEKIYPIYKADNYIDWLNIDKTSVKARKKNDCLNKLNMLYWQKSWKSSSYYKNQKAFTKEQFKGPSHIAIFTDIKNDSLRIDVISNSKDGIKYCGTVYKYLLIFDKNRNIVESKKWKDNYECW